MVKSKRENPEVKKPEDKYIKTGHLCMVKRAKNPGEEKTRWNMYIKLHEKASCTGNGAKKHDFDCITKSQLLSVCPLLR